MTWPANGAEGGRHLFLIEMEAAPDAVMRVLGPFALHEAELTALALTRGEGRLDLRVEAVGFGFDLADRLGRKLRALPVVRGVSLGWVG
jgi:hypothetical protein